MKFSRSLKFLRRNIETKGMMEMVHNDSLDKYPRTRKKKRKKVEDENYESFWNSYERERKKLKKDNNLQFRKEFQIFFKDFRKLLFIDILFIIIISLFLLILKSFSLISRFPVGISGNIQGRFTRALKVFISLYRETVLPNQHGQHAPRNNCSHSEPFTLLVKIISSPYFHVLSILSFYVTFI